MIETLVWNLPAGMLLGLFFFGGLWLTVRNALHAKIPALWFLLSFVVRMAVALVGFYAISKTGHWQSLVAALVGFVIVRVVLIRVQTKPPQLLTDPSVTSSKEAAIKPSIKPSVKAQEHAS